MCGIVGFVSLGFDCSRDESYSTVSRMLEAISHRGPDGADIYISECGLYGLGHVRLAIRDLSDAGKQPMFSKGMTGVITYNGEVYNSDDIKSEYGIGPLRGSSDTEVLANFIELVGVDAALTKINGMFSFCYVDVVGSEAFLVRDQYGKKPLFYMVYDDKLFFSSEIKSFKMANKTGLNIDKSKILDFMSLGYVAGEDSFFEGVKSVPPGSYLKIDLKDHKTSIRKYFIREATHKMETPGDSTDLFGRIRKSIDMRLVSDVPISLFLSGGIDSSLIAMILSEIESDVCAHTVAFSNSQFDESKDALAVAKKLGIGCKLIHIEENQLIESCDNLMQVFDQPFADIGVIPYYALCERVSGEGYKVALSGDGGDELFMGYRKYIYLKKMRVLAKFINSDLSVYLGKLLLSKQAKLKVSEQIRLKLLKFLLLCANKGGYKNILELRSDAVFDCLSDSYKNIFIAKFLDGPVNSSDLTLDELRIKDLDGYLPDNMMVKSDLVSMRFGLEVRSPLLDIGIEDRAMHFSEERLVNGKFGKLELRSYVAAKLGSSIAFKNKKGFSPPMHEWLVGPLIGLVERMLEEFPAELNEVFVMEKVKSNWAKARHSGLDSKQSQDLWSLIVLKSVIDRQ